MLKGKALRFQTHFNTTVIPLHEIHDIFPYHFMTYHFLMRVAVFSGLPHHMEGRHDGSSGSTARAHLCAPLSN
jgi:hypothetical protein